MPEDSKRRQLSQQRELLDYDALICQKGWDNTVSSCHYLRRLEYWRLLPLVDLVTIYIPKTGFSSMNFRSAHEQPGIYIKPNTTLILPKDQTCRSLHWPFWSPPLNLYLRQSIPMTPKVAKLKRSKGLPSELKPRPFPKVLWTVFNESTICRQTLHINLVSDMEVLLRTFRLSF